MTDTLLTSFFCCLPVQHEEDVSTQHNETVAMLIKEERQVTLQKLYSEIHCPLFGHPYLHGQHKGCSSLFAFKALLSALAFPSQLVTLCSHTFCFVPSYSYQALNTSFRMFMQFFFWLCFSFLEQRERRRGND